MALVISLISSSTMWSLCTVQRMEEKMSKMMIIVFPRMFAGGDSLGICERTDDLIAVHPTDIPSRP